MKSSPSSPFSYILEDGEEASNLALNVRNIAVHDTDAAVSRRYSAIVWYLVGSRQPYSNLCHATALLIGSTAKGKEIKGDVKPTFQATRCAISSNVFTF